jgi:low temperature requirement protein LtrA
MKRVSIISPDDQRVSFVELFFDLIFVFCVTQVATLLHHHVDAHSSFTAVLVFWMVWWAWTQFTWALNAANTEHPRVQIATLIATAIAFLLAVGIPTATGEGAAWFAGTYVALRGLGLVIYYWVAWGVPELRRAVRVFGLFSALGMASVLAGGCIGGEATYIWWGLAILLDLTAARIGGQLDGWNLHPEHFAERHGLIVIIALGETLIVAASGLIAAPTALGMMTGLLAVAVTAGLWWSYFRFGRQTLEHALASSTGSARSRMARDVFSVLHFPMLCGVIAMAAATGLALSHPDQALDLGARAALGGGAFLFLASSAVAFWRAIGTLPVWRIGAGALAVLLVLTVGSFPAVAMGILLVLLVALAVFEQPLHEAGGSG